MIFSTAQRLSGNKIELNSMKLEENPKKLTFVVAKAFVYTNKIE